MRNKSVTKSNPRGHYQGRKPNRLWQLGSSRVCDVTICDVTIEKDGFLEYVKFAKLYYSVSRYLHRKKRF